MTEDMDDASFLPAIEQDAINAPILLMGVTQKYFRSYCVITCGIPSVILVRLNPNRGLIYHCLDEIEPLRRTKPVL